MFLTTAISGCKLYAVKLKSLFVFGVNLLMFQRCLILPNHVYSFGMFAQPFIVSDDIGKSPWWDEE